MGPKPKNEFGPRPGPKRSPIRSKLEFNPAPRKFNNIILINESATRMRKDEEKMMKWILQLNLIFYPIWTLKPKLVWTLNNPHF